MAIDYRPTAHEFGLTFKLSLKSRVMLKLLPKRFKKGLERGLILSMRKVQSTAQTNAPIGKTGNLRRGIKGYVETKGENFLAGIGEVGPALVYAAIQEFGGTAGQGAKLKGKRFVYRAFTDEENNIASIINKAILEEI